MAENEERPGDAEALINDTIDCTASLDFCVSQHVNGLGGLAFNGHALSELYETGVDIVFDAIADADCEPGDFTLRDMADSTLEVIRALLNDANRPEKDGGRALCFGKAKVLPPEAAAYIMSRVKRLAYVLPESELYSDSAVGALTYYDDEPCDTANPSNTYGTYRRINDTVRAAWAAELCGTFSKKWSDDFKHGIESYAKPVAECGEVDYVALNNCILNVRTKERVEFSPSIVLRSKFPVNLLDKLPECPTHVLPNGITVDVLDILRMYVPYEGGLDFLLMIITAALRSRYNWRKMVTLYNKDGSNGKSTFLDLIASIVGGGNVMATSLSTLCDDTYGLRGIDSKTTVLCDDSNAGTYIRDTARAKSLIAHGLVEIKGKYEHSITSRPSVLIINAANELPRSKDKSEAWNDRNIIVPFMPQFKGGADDPSIKDVFVRSPEVAEYLVYLCLVERPYFERNDLIAAMPVEVRRANDEYVENNDVVVAFWHWMEPQLSGDVVFFGYAWKIYQQWVAEERPGGDRLAKKAFTESLRRVAEAEGWVAPRKKDGKLAEKSVAAWLPGEERFVGVSLPAASGLGDRAPLLVRKPMYDYCMEHNVTPKDLGDQYETVRRQLGIGNPTTDADEEPTGDPTAATTGHEAAPAPVTEPVAFPTVTPAPNVSNGNAPDASGQPDAGGDAAEE